MNTTNATNATPTPAAPLTPEPPKCCPACGSGKNSQDAAKVHTYYDCGNRYSPVLIDNNGDKKLSWVWGGGCSRAFDTAMKLISELEKTQARYNAEIEQFNAGYDAGKAGLDLQEQEQRWRMLHDNDYDAFAPGYAWGAFDKLRAEWDALKSELKRYKELMPCGHPSMLAVLNDASIPVCSVCWLELAYAERDAALARAEKAEAERDAARTSELKWLQAYQVRVKQMDNEIAALTARLAELQAVCDAGQAVQVERDCAAVCNKCNEGYPVEFDGRYFHRIGQFGVKECRASLIRSAHSERLREAKP